MSFQEEKKDNAMFDNAKIEKMLKTAPPRRPYEAKKLAEYFLATNSYFRALSEGDNGLPMEAFIQICAGMTLEEYDHGSIIF